MDGAHLQTGWVVLSEEADPTKAINELVEKRLRPVVKKHSEEGRIKWAFREVAIHGDEKKLFGYCFKVCLPRGEVGEVGG